MKNKKFSITITIICTLLLLNILSFIAFENTIRVQVFENASADKPVPCLGEIELMSRPVVGELCIACGQLTSSIKCEEIGSGCQPILCDV